MATIRTIEPVDGYLYVRFSGEALRIRDGFESAVAAHHILIKTACEKYGCRKVLLDLRNVTRSIGLTEEHIAAAVAIKQWLPGQRVAFVASDSYFADAGGHMERVACNRGAALQIFRHIDEAKAWLTAEHQFDALSA